MELKKLEKPKRLQIYESLSGRRELTADEQYDMYLIKLGFYDGELPFNKLSVKHLPEDVMVISDLRVNDGQWYQIDSIILSDWKLYLNEVKYLTGDLSYLEGDLYLNGVKMKDDYLRKLRRVAELLEFALRKRGFTIEVVPNLVFMNPRMNFYGNTPKLPVLMYHQIEPFLEGIQPRVSHYTHRIAEFLLSLHTEDNPFDRKEIPADFDTLRKGIRCAECGSLDLFSNSHKLICTSCNHAGTKEDGVVRNVKEYQTLWPNKKLSRTAIYEWCDGKVSRARIHTILTLIENSPSSVKV